MGGAHGKRVKRKLLEPPGQIQLQYIIVVDRVQHPENRSQKAVNGQTHEGDDFAEFLSFIKTAVRY